MKRVQFLLLVLVPISPWALLQHAKRSPLSPARLCLTQQNQAGGGEGMGVRGITLQPPELPPHPYPSPPPPAGLASRLILRAGERGLRLLQMRAESSSLL